VKDRDTLGEEFVERLICSGKQIVGMKRALSLLITGAMLLLMLPQPVLAGNQVGVLSHFVTVPVAGLAAEGVANKGDSFYVSTIAFAPTATHGSIFVFDKKGTLTQTFTLPGLPIVGQAAIFKDSLFVVACSGIGSGGAVVKIDLPQRADGGRPRQHIRRQLRRLD